MKKIMLLTLILSILLFACASNQSGGVIKLGSVSPLTGDAAIYGEASRNGLQLAVDEINSNGGINGKQIEIVYEDGKCNAKDASTAGNKLIDVDKVPVIVGTVCSSETLAIAPIAEENHVVVLSVASSSPDITKSGDYIFRTWPSDAGQADIMANHIYNDEKLTKVALIYTNSDYNKALANAFKKKFESLNGKILDEEVHEQGSKDFRTEIAKIMNAKPEAVYMVPYTEGGIVTKQLKELGFSGKVFTSETYATADTLKDAGDSSEGVVYATPKFDEKMDKTAEFLAKYKAKYNKDSPFSVVSANAYDAVYLLANAFKEKGIGADDIKAYLYTVKDYPGVAGTLTIDSNGDALKEFQLMMVNNGEFEKIGS